MSQSKPVVRPKAQRKPLETDLGFEWGFGIGLRDVVRWDVHSGFGIWDSVGIRGLGFVVDVLSGPRSQVPAAAL